MTQGYFFKSRNMFNSFSNLILLLSLIIIFNIVTIPVAFGLQIIKGSNKINQESRELKAFSKIKMNINGNLTIRPSEKLEPLLKITAEDNLLQYIHTYIENDTLHIEFKNISMNKEINTKTPVKKISENTVTDDIVIKNCQPIELQLHIAELCEIETFGNNNVEVASAIPSDKLTLHLNGQGKVNVNVDSTKLLLKIAGTKELILKGRVHDQTIEMAGNCKLLSQELRSKNTTIKLIGQGKAEVNASTYLNADIWGNGEINYLGSPKVSEKILGGGRLKAY